MINFGSSKASCQSEFALLAARGMKGGGRASERIFEMSSRWGTSGTAGCRGIVNPRGGTVAGKLSVARIVRYSRTA